MMKGIGFAITLFSVLFSNIETATATPKTDTSGKKLRHRNRDDGRVKENHRRAKEKQKESEKDSDSDCSASLPRDGMSPTDVKRSAMAAKMSKLVYELGKGTIAVEDEAISEMLDGSYGMYYESGIDAVYNARIGNDYCAIAFRGTFGQQEDPRKDMMSNLLVDPVPFESGDGALCDIHSGYYDSYFNFEHRSSGIEDFLETCLKDCPTCEVMLTGHSQGGALAEVAALYYLRGNQKVAADSKVHVVTFGSPQALGAGCLPLFTKEERCRFSHYVMTIEGTFGNGLVYDPIPMVYARGLGDMDNDGEMNSYTDSYARHGGLAFIGFEVFLNPQYPSSVVLGGFDGHYNAATSKLDFSIDAHDSGQYVEVLVKQSELYPSADYQHTECYLPTDGFSLGCLCNEDESDFHCVPGLSECKSQGKWWHVWHTEHRCEAIGKSVLSSDRFCHQRPFQWTMVP